MDPRMGPFDAVMFGVEDDPVLRSFITVLIETDDPPDEERLRYRVERLTRLVPKMRQRVVGNPFSLVPPRWETERDFSLNYHLRAVALPQGTMDELLAALSDWAQRDFDRARPLWEMIYFTGLRGGRGAVGVKIHHAITDGVGALQLAAALLDLAPDAPDPEDMPDAPQASLAGWRDRVEQGSQFESSMLVDGVVGLAKTAFGAGKAAVTDPGGSVVASTEFFSSAGRVLAPAPEPLSPIMTQRSLREWFAELSYDLSDLKAAAKGAGGTLNDAFMAAVLGGLRSYHAAHGGVPAELRVNMPVNTRTAAQATEAGGNRWVPVRLPLPLNEEDPTLRIRQLHPILAQARNEPALTISDPVYKVLMTLPRALTTRIAGGLMKGTDFAATNVPGPPFPVFIAGARVNRLIPFAPKAGASLNIGLMSYNGRAEIGINIDREAVPDVEFLVECIDNAFKEILATIDA
jgi:diacylglycerol O-acyltransferase / wax synthase